MPDIKKKDTDKKSSDVKRKGVKAVAAYAPRIKLERIAEQHQLAKFISDRSTMHEGTVLNMVAELRTAIMHFAYNGQPLRLPGVGLFTPSISLEGQLNIKFKPDAQFKRDLNREGLFEGEIINKDMIGKTTEELVQRWNEEHPDDQVVF